MVTEIVRNRTPQDDYNRIHEQIRYIMQYDFSNIPEKPEQTKKMKGTGAYKAMFNAIKGCFIASGAFAVLSLITWLVNRFVLEINPVNTVFGVFVIATIIFLYCALLITCIGAFIESRTEKKDKKININLDSKTWVLNDGRIVVSDEQRLRCMQQYDSKIRLPIAEAPFLRLQIIWRVYSFMCADGKITADADVIELYRKHPYLNDVKVQSEEQDSDLYYYYCQRNKRDKIIWYENMHGRDFLLQALTALKA